MVPIFDLAGVMEGLFIGLTTVDIIYPLHKFPLENEKARAEEVLIDLGGPAMNAAFTFAALGGKSTLVTWIGHHTLKSYMLDTLQSYGIATIDLNAQQEREPVISSVILNTNTGSRTIYTSQVNMGIKVVDPNLDPSDFDIICVDGFFGDYAYKILEHNRCMVPVVFDGGSYKKSTDILLPHVNYPIFSEVFQPPGSIDMRSYLSQWDHIRFAITRGDQPIYYLEDRQEGEITVPKVKAVDSLAAGDIFHGAFCKYILENQGNFKESLREAATVASLSCAHIGPRKWADFL